MQIEAITNQVAGENTYFIYNKENLLIIDPGSDVEKIIDAIRRINRKPVAILLTHTHYDHIVGLELIRKKYEIPVYVSPLEQEWLTNPQHNGSLNNPFVPDIYAKPAEFEFELRDYELGGMTFSVVATPGHSIGSLSFVFEDFVVVGDALFKGSIGRTDLYSGDLGQLLASITENLFSLPRELPAYPGHGEATTIGHEIDTNPFFNN